MKINEKEYTLRMSGKTLVIYKEEFKKDMLLETNRFVSKGLEDMTLLMELAYALIKTTSDDIGTYMEFVDEINPSEFFSVENVQEIVLTIRRDREPTNQLKKK